MTPTSRPGSGSDCSSAAQQTLDGLLTAAQQSAVRSGFQELLKRNRSPDSASAAAHRSQIMFMAVAGTLGLGPGDFGTLRAVPHLGDVLGLLMDRSDEAEPLAA